MFATPFWQLLRRHQYHAVTALALPLDYIGGVERGGPAAIGSCISMILFQRRVKGEQVDLFRRKSWIKANTKHGSVSDNYDAYVAINEDTGQVSVVKPLLEFAKKSLSLVILVRTAGLDRTRIGLWGPMHEPRQRP